MRLPFLSPPDSDDERVLKGIRAGQAQCRYGDRYTRDRRQIPVWVPRCENAAVLRFRRRREGARWEFRCTAHKPNPTTEIVWLEAAS